MSTPLRQNVTFPVGRLISGSVSEARTKDNKGNPLLDKAGQPRSEFAFGVAYEKNGAVAFYQTPWGAIIYGVARAAFPHMYDPNGLLKPGYKFSYKVTDGDSTEFNTAVPPTRPCDVAEWKGCFIVWFNSKFAPSTYDVRQWTPAQGGSPPALDASEIQCGDYVQVAGSIDSNGDTQKSGTYANHSMVALAGYHPAGRIVRGPDASKAGFGEGVRPAGMVLAPVGGLPAVVSPAAHAPLPPAASAPLPLPPAAAQPPQTPVAPYPAILQPGAAVPPPPAAVAPAPPSGPQATAKAGGATWAQLQTAGWTEDVARQHGMIV